MEITMKNITIPVGILMTLAFLLSGRAQGDNPPVLKDCLGQILPRIMEENTSSGPLPAEGYRPAWNVDDQKIGDPRLKGLSQIILRILEEWDIPGCALVIVENSEVLFSGGFGYRELRSKSLVDEHTIFPIASCTKAFTAALIGILADEGKLDIDKPANNYLPILNFSDPLLTLQVTPRDMLTHRTGIPRHDNSWFGFENASRDRLVQLIQYFPKSAGLREKFQYNNYMYVALGAMAEHVEKGKSWEDQIKDRFFIPLEMNSSSAFEKHQQSENIAYPHEVSFDMKPIEVPFVHSQNMAPDGSINSNARDIAKWLITWINGGEFKNKIIIPKSFYSQAISTQWGSPSGPSTQIQYLGYGLGWNLAIYRGHYSVFHGGGGNGFSSLVLFLPSDSLGLALFANKRASDALMIMANTICDKLLKLPYIDWNANKINDYKNELIKYNDQFILNFNGSSKNPHPPSHPLEAYYGTYSNPGYGKMTISQKEDSLFGNYGSLILRLRHNTYDAFTAFLYRWEELFGKFDVINRPAVFHQNSRGEISELAILLERAVDPIIFKKDR
jgi:CubicO group peptidase (beta-lactamase class C family)